MDLKIAILGDFNTAYATHHALNKVTEEVQGVLPAGIRFHWLGTDVFNPEQVFEQEGYAGLWIAPGSPYRDDENVIHAITYARTRNIPTLGNCGGFQYMLIEFARKVCGIEQAGHEETDADAKEPVISKLSCSLVEKEEMLNIKDHSSLLYDITRKEHFPGRYYCSYGLNEAYRRPLEEHGLSFTAFSTEGHVRAFELKTHPFFLGTLFQPALTSAAEMPNPVILSFIRHSLKNSDILNSLI